MWLIRGRNFAVAGFPKDRRARVRVCFFICFFNGYSVMLRKNISAPSDWNNILPAEGYAADPWLANLHPRQIVPIDRREVLRTRALFDGLSLPFLNRGLPEGWPAILRNAESSPFAWSEQTAN